MKKTAVASLCVALCLALLCSCSFIAEYIPGFSPNETSGMPNAALPAGVQPGGHYYDKLSSVERGAYETLLCSIYAHEGRAYLPELTERELSDIFQSVYYDNPQLVCLENKFGWGTFGNKTFIELHYSESAEACAEKSAEIKAAVAQSEAVLSDGMDDFEKELALHDWLASRCVYGSGSSSPYTAYGALIGGSAVCEGYAKAMQLLLDNAGVKSYVVTGQTEIDGEMQGHMWNVVKINGESYHLDATWDDSQDDDGLIQHTYFNLSDEEISSDHFGFDTAETRCTAEAENYFRRSGVCFDDYDALCAYVERALQNGDEFPEFRLDSAELYEHTIKKLFDEGGIYDIIEGVNLPDDNYEGREVAYIGSPTQRTVLLTID